MSGVKNGESIANRMQISGHKDMLVTESTAFLFARYCLLNAIAEEALRSIHISTPLAEKWWSTSSTVNDLAKSFIAGNVRTLREDNVDNMDDLFPANNEVRLIIMNMNIDV